MIALAIFEQMAEDQVAGLTKNKDFFYGQMPLQNDGNPAKGVWIIERGGTASNNRYNSRMTLDFYVANGNQTKIDSTQAKILEWIMSNRCICELKGQIGDASYHYENIRIRPTTTPENAGATENGLIVKTASAEIIYDLAN